MLKIGIRAIVGIKEKNVSGMTGHIPLTGEIGSEEDDISS